MIYLIFSNYELQNFEKLLENLKPNVMIITIIIKIKKIILKIQNKNNCNYNSFWKKNNNNNNDKHVKCW